MPVSMRSASGPKGRSLFRSAASRTGSLIATAGATSTLAHDHKLYDRTGDELRLDGVERIRI